MQSSVFLLFFFTVLCTFANGLEEGEKCMKDGADGVCKNIRDCQSAIDDIKMKKRPQICTFSGVDPVVCCPTGGIPAPTTTPRPVVATTQRRPSSTTTEYVPPVYDYQENTDFRKGSGECSAIPANQTAKKTDKKAWNKCIEYQEELVYPCEKGVSLSGEKSRGNHCHHKADELVVGGTDASRGEFPHMVLLGFGNDASSAEWVCAGTLISDQFILTAGHCTSSRDLGPVSFARLGVFQRSEGLDASRVYRIGDIIKHPDYKPPQKYNDIALLKTENRMKLDQFAVPACLDTGAPASYERASASGWGATQYKGGVAEILQKVVLTHFTDSECSRFFPSERLMKEGYRASTQMCFGDRTKSKDTCQGDSGGPLQIKNQKIHCMYTIIGVTSFGKACGVAGVPGIYTRVAAFTDWIESIVWP